MVAKRQPAREPKKIYILAETDRDMRAWKRTMAFIRRRARELGSEPGTRTWTRDELYDRNDRVSLTRT